jgi:hypothetical protein
METPKVSEVLHWLYGVQKKTKIDLGRAEARPNVTAEELDVLNRKLIYIDYLIGLTLKEE